MKILAVVISFLFISLPAAAQDNSRPGAPFDILGLRQRAIEQRQEMTRRSAERLREIEAERQNKLQQDREEAARKETAPPDETKP